MALRHNAFVTKACYIALAVIVALAAGPKFHAQSAETAPNRGTTPTGSYTLSNIETIDNVAGNVFLRIPMASMPPGRAGWSTGVNLTYNSSIYDATQGEGSTTVYALGPSTTGGGWQLGFQHTLDVEDAPTCSNNNVPGYKLRLITPDGASHALRLIPPFPAITDKQGDAFYNIDPRFPQSYVDASCNAHVTSGITTLTYFTADGSFITVILDR